MYEQEIQLVRSMLAVASHVNYNFPISRCKHIGHIANECRAIRQNFIPQNLQHFFPTNRLQNYTPANNYQNYDQRFQVPQQGPQISQRPTKSRSKYPF